MPHVECFVQRLPFVLHGEVDDRGRAAVRRADRPGLEIIGRRGAAERQVHAAKTYIRRANDYDLIASRLEGLLPSNLYLEADICRADLLLEIECVAR